MTRVGPKQRDLLARMCVGRAVVVGDALTRSLCRRGLMKAHRGDDVVTVTAAGLRALADEMDAGRVPNLDPRVWPGVTP